MGLNTNAVVLAVLNNQLDQAEQLLAETSPGEIETLTAETITALIDAGYQIDHQTLDVFFLIIFIFDRCKNENTNAKLESLLYQTFDAYETASIYDYFHALLYISDEINHHFKKSAYCYPHGLGKSPNPMMSSIESNLLSIILKKPYPAQTLINLLAEKRAFSTSKKITSLMPEYKGSRSQTDYGQFYNALKQSHEAPTLFTALIQHALLSNLREDKKFTGSHLEKLDEQAKRCGETLKLQLPLSEDQLLSYLNSDIYTPEDCNIKMVNVYRGTTPKTVSCHELPEEQKQAKFKTRYELLRNLGLSEEKIKAELLKPYLLGTIRQEYDLRSYSGSNSNKHYVFPQWQIRGLLNMLQLNINDKLIDNEKPIIACYKQGPVNVLEHLISAFPDIALDNDDVNALIEATKENHAALNKDDGKTSHAANKDYLFTPLKSKVAVIYNMLSDFEPHKLHFLQEMHQLNLLPKALQDTFKKEQDRLNHAMKIMNKVCKRLNIDEITQEAINIAREEILHPQVKPKKKKPSEVTNPGTAPNPEPAITIAAINPEPLPALVTRQQTSTPALAANPGRNAQLDSPNIDDHMNPMNNLAQFARDGLDDQAKDELLKMLLSTDVNEETMQLIIGQLKSISEKKFIKLKLTLIAHAARHSGIILPARIDERASNPETPKTYLTFILGLGRSHFLFKHTKSLTDLDVKLGLMTQPSVLTNSFMRLTRWATTPSSKSVNQTTPTLNSSQ